MHVVVRATKSVPLQIITQRSCIGDLLLELFFDSLVSVSDVIGIMLELFQVSQEFEDVLHMWPSKRIEQF